jgi:hypothetical protein
MAKFERGDKRKRRALPRGAAILGLALLFTLGAAGAGAAASPPLTGEDLEWSSPGPFPLGEFNGNFACFGPPNEGDYAVDQGVASGPYPGTFHEDGSFTVSGGVVTGWTAHFIIYDATGASVVTGDKTMVSGTGGPGSVNCSGTFPFTNSGSGSATVTYTANLPDGTTDSGTSAVSGSFTETGDSMAGSTFSEMFGVRTPAQQLQDLITQLQGQPLGPGNSLVSKLQAILKSVEAGKTKTACNQLHALENELAAQSGKSVPPDAGILSAIQQVETSLGC